VKISPHRLHFAKPKLGGDAADRYRRILLEKLRQRRISPGFIAQVIATWRFVS